MSIKNVRPEKLTEELSEELKKLGAIKPPEWSHFVKTGPHKERPPDQPDWWFLRSASILRKVYEKGPIGVSRLRSLYGGRAARGSSPERFRQGSGKIVRTMLQQLEEAGLVKKIKGEGRKIAPQGKSLLDKLANKMNSGEGS
ncbi:30S ribosomal protein S19 [candidate division MSBL1 archaeon SCGC-AAA259B11]|uniref:Small ribosomal subunit protein eS19 n=1 Tax=candidate division MSBL1 archaeon SCGC-AAA259B11 TaxID=1698260 RepID=A0A133U5I0_9EURY|nr:30S ribosomal protein S19 [candidate division MSBL1 archaeon SCGC-AAA259B11]